MYRELLNEPFFKPALRSLPTSKEAIFLHAVVPNHDPE